MSKKNGNGTRKRPALRLVPKVPNLNERHEPVAELLPLDELCAVARDLISSENWIELEQHARMPITRIRQEDRERAKTILLCMLVHSLNEQHLKDKVDARVRKDLKSAVRALADSVDSLHEMPLFFDLYLRHTGWSKPALLDAFNRLIRACEAQVNLDWIKALRHRGLRLLNRQEDQVDDLRSDTTIPSDIPDVLMHLDQALTRAEADASIVGVDRTMLEVLRHDLCLRTLDPWNYRQAAEGFTRLSTPPEQAETDEEREYATDAGARFTARSWAFVWELEHTEAKGLRSLIERYPHPLGHDTVEGLRQIVLAATANGTDVDAHMVRGLRHLMDGLPRSDILFGSVLSIAVDSYVCEIDLSPGLRMQDPASLLASLLESAPEEFARIAELECLCRAFPQLLYFGFAEDEQSEPIQHTAALQWLFDQSLSFQFHIAYGSPDSNQRFRLILDCLCRSGETGEDLPYSHCAPDLLDVALTPEGRSDALERLRRLAAVRESLPPKSNSIWLQTVGAIFATLMKDKDAKRIELLDLARKFSADLLTANHAFLLALLEQVSGDARSALRHYLTDLDRSDEPIDTLVSNSRLLWDQSDDVSLIEGLAEVLEQGLAATKHPDVVRGLLAHARTRFDAVQQREQFEKTAVARWPSLSAPARKVLLVLASIKTYSSIDELARYAAMDATWVKRHHDQLHRLGMVLRAGDSYRINPHIEPLLARESQHSVIGRIVRSQGTSGVKQVFNSQREFDIYQVLVQLCPNHLVFPNCALQSIMSYERMKELVSEDDFGYYLRASVDIVVVSSTTFLPMLAVEVDSVWHDLERQKVNDEKKDRLFAAAGIAFMRLRPVGNPSVDTIRAQVSEHVDGLVRTLRSDLPGYDQARRLLVDLANIKA